jgi:predicted transcriptional regulator
LRHDVRLAVLLLLMQHAPPSVRAGEIAAAQDIRQNTLPANLGLLENIGLIRSSR